MTLLATSDARLKFKSSNNVVDASSNPAGMVHSKRRAASSTFFPKGSTDTLAPLASANTLFTCFTTLLLKAPHNPRLEDTAITNVFRTSRVSLYAPSPDSKLALTFANMPCNFSAYGRIRVMASCARRSLAADTIFIAEVICMVFCTEEMRSRTS